MKRKLAWLSSLLALVAVLGVSGAGAKGPPLRATLELNEFQGTATFGSVQTIWGIRDVVRLSGLEPGYKYNMWVIFYSYDSGSGCAYDAEKLGGAGPWTFTANPNGDAFGTLGGYTTPLEPYCVNWGLFVNPQPQYGGEVAFTDGLVVGG